VWYLPLEDSSGKRKTEDELQAAMRKTTRNLIRRAEKDGVTIETYGKGLRNYKKRFNDGGRLLKPYSCYSVQPYWNGSKVPESSEKEDLCS
jgi:hypothetical protein